MSKELKQWIVKHNSDYAKVRERLEYVRNIVLNGRIDAAADILERSYMFGVLSIQTQKDRHESAFVAHYSGNVSRKEAALQTVYGGNKKRWIAKTFENVNWELLAIAVRYHHKNDNYSKLLDVVVNNVTGVSHRKGSFMLAMCGLHEYMCIDSNVGNYGNIDPNDEYYSSESYFDTCKDICDSVGINYLPAFILQWAIYDFERGEHSRHMTYFNEILPNL
jgi:thermostable 8-oxoguanine DNA glycosylase